MPIQTLYSYLIVWILLTFSLTGSRINEEMNNSQCMFVRDFKLE